MDKLLLAATLAGAAYLGLALALQPDSPSPADAPPATYLEPDHADQALENAYRTRARNHQVSGSGTVIKLLPDDNEGSRHQRFILRLSSGRTLLVSHNIDLAPRIASLQVGDSVEFNGEYEWNAKGGVLHWTHHDPQRRHEAGWLKHRNRLYQ